MFLSKTCRKCRGPESDPDTERRSGKRDAENDDEDDLKVGVANYNFKRFAVF